MLEYELVDANSLPGIQKVKYSVNLFYGIPQPTQQQKRVMVYAN